MYYQILANKWRPKTFADVVGQKHVIMSLTNSLLKKKIHHAYLFSGTRGVGKTTIARLLAKGLNCINNLNQLPCGKCDHCIEIEHNKFIDLIEIDAASRTKIEDMRELLDNLQYLPSKSIFKIYLIDEVHMLSRYSFNALLKTLEEPPHHIKFFLATTEPKKIPTTILSRCLQLHLKSIDKELILQHLKLIFKNEKIEADDESLEIIAKEANGSIRDALTLTDQIITVKKNIKYNDVQLMLGLCNKHQILDLVESILTINTKKLMFLLQQISINNIEWDNLLIEVLEILHKILMLKILNNQQTKNSYEKKIINIFSNISSESIQSYYKIILIGRKELSLFPDHKTAVEIICLRLLSFITLEKNKSTNIKNFSDKNFFLKKKVKKMIEKK